MTRSRDNAVSRCRGEITARLRDGNADPQAMAFVFSQLYYRLRKLAGRALASERRDHTLETGGLVAEAYFRLIEQQRPQWNDREHFIAIAAQMMRRILVDYGRRRSAAKRHPGGGALPLQDAVSADVDALLDLMPLGDALEALRQIRPQHSEIVQLRFFGGLTNQEIASCLGLSLPTVERHWRLARAWLYRYLTSAEHRS
jgi:RNA polymerase sigma factor (TIGR02999 family)